MVIFVSADPHLLPLTNAHKQTNKQTNEQITRQTNNTTFRQKPTKTRQNNKQKIKIKMLKC
jgi:hypothetical protein